VNKEQEELLAEAYENYQNYFLGYDDIPNKELFILTCKTDTKLAEKWGLKFEERMLSDEESVFHYEKELYSPLRIIDQKIPVVPTKLITITYNDKTLKNYL